MQGSTTHVDDVIPREQVSRPGAPAPRQFERWLARLKIAILTAIFVVISATGVEQTLFFFGLCFLWFCVFGFSHRKSKIAWNTTTRSALYDIIEVKLGGRR